MTGKWLCSTLGDDEFRYLVNHCNGLWHFVKFEFNDCALIKKYVERRLPKCW